MTCLGHTNLVLCGRFFSLRQKRPQLQSTDINWFVKIDYFVENLLIFNLNYHSKVVQHKTKI